jgi:hypothetical protein
VSLNMMRTIKQWRIIRLGFYWVLLLGIVPVVCAGAFGPDDPFSRETLRGLGAVHVVIEHLQPNAERAGLTRSQVQTDVELRLRKAGIRVLKEQEKLASPGMPYLYIISFECDQNSWTVGSSGSPLQHLGFCQCRR